MSARRDCGKRTCKNDYAQVQTASLHARHRSGGRDPAVASGTAPATTIPHTFADDCRTRNQERRASACRGCGYRDCDAVRRCSVGSLSHMGHRHCQRVTVIHGGIMPPALGPARVRWCCANVCGIFLAGAVSEPRGAYAPPALVQAPFARRRNCDFHDVQTHMHRSGGRQPAVVLETYLHTRFRNCSADCRPVRWRTPLQPRSCNYGELTPPALGRAGVRPPTELRLLRCTNAHARGAAGVSPPWLR